MRTQISFLLFLALLSFGHAWFETCNVKLSVTTSTSYITSPRYPNLYSPGSSCKYYLEAPTGYIIELKCSFDLMESEYDCSSQRLYVSREGDKELNYAEFFCGYSSFTRVSVGNEISFGYTSNADGDGWYSCEARAVLTTQDNCQCGWSRSARIVGGSIASPSEYVSMAGLVDITEKNTPEGPIFCGSAIISENYALTAAHCFNVNRDISVIYLLVGDHDITTGDDTPYPALYATRKIIKHSGYVPTSENQSNDIALLQTAEAIRWKKTIGPACLPFIYRGYDTYFDGYFLTVLGWGTTEFAGPTSTVLKKASLAVIANSKCNETYGDVTVGKICTYTQGTDSCQRDSGGSLYWGYNNRKYTVGIVSYGKACGSKYPSVNTRVTAYLDWIVAQMPGAFLCQMG